MDNSTGKDGELAELQFGMFNNCPLTGVQYGEVDHNGITASLVSSKVPLDSEQPRGPPFKENPFRAALVRLREQEHKFYMV